MSDLYLVLRNRLDAVAEWVAIEPEILRSARERRGFSYETMAREIHVSSKTWERYEKAGRVPRHALPLIAAVLELEIEEPARPRILVGSEEERSQLVELLRGVDRKLDALDRKFDVDRQAIEDRVVALQEQLGDALRARLEA